MNIVTLKTLQRLAPRRLPGYVEAVQAIATTQSDGSYGLTDEQWDQIKSKYRLPLGTKIQNVIHAAVDASPLPPHTKAAIKSCPGCRKRVSRINGAQAKAQFFLAKAGNLLHKKP